jgi:hypothetical protein
MFTANAHVGLITDTQGGHRQGTTSAPRKIYLGMPTMTKAKQL